MAVRKKHRLKHGIRSRVLWPTLLLIALQTVLLVGGVHVSGVLRNLEKNAMDVMKSRVEARRDYLQYDMMNRWFDLDAFEAQLTAALSDYLDETKADPESLYRNTALSEGFLTRADDILVDTMRRNSVTGAFLLLYAGDAPAAGEQMPGLYIRDRDPVSAYADGNNDLLLLRAPMRVTAETGIATDSNWRPLFEPQDAELEAYFTPYTAAKAHPDAAAGQLAYLSRTHTAYGDNLPCITFSMPLIAPDGTVCGVFGTDILFDYLEKELPFEEIGSSFGAYLLAVTPSGEPPEIVFESSTALSLLGVGETQAETVPMDGSGFYRLRVEGENAGVICATKFSVYDADSVFAGERWTLCGVQPEDQLYAVPYETMWSLAVVAGIALAASILVAFLIVRSLERPVARLEREVRMADSGSPAHFTGTNIRELDLLAEAVQSLNAEVARTAGKLSNFLEMSSVNLGAFELDIAAHRVFTNRGFFTVFGEAVPDSRRLSYDAFTSKLRGYERFALEEASGYSDGAYYRTFEIPAEKGTVWVRMQVELTEAYATGFVEDVTAEYRERRRLEYQRDRDALTGIRNRRAFYARYNELFQNPQALQHAGVLMLDLDNLKYLNDKYGHDCGDSYISAAAQALLDFSPENAVVSRISGDEFLVFLYGYPTQEAMLEDVERLRRGFTERHVRLPGDGRYPLRISAGVACYPQDSTEPETLVRFADFAMYTGKHSIKGKFIRFDAARYAKEAFLLQGKEALNVLIEQEAVHYYFQPIVDLYTGEVHAYEALMRPQVPGLEQPYEVLRLARQESKLAAIEKLTWFCAMQAFAEHSKEGLVRDTCKIFINSISNQRMTDEEVAAFEARFGPWLSRVVQEHTEEEESTPEIYNSKISILRRWGAGVAIDDFGSGYSGEMILLSIDPDYVKADINLIRDIDKNRNKQARLKALVQYTAPRSIEIVGEGVETAEELRTLRALGIRYAQGYFLGMPALLPQGVLPEAAAVIERLREADEMNTETQEEDGC